MKRLSKQAGNTLVLVMVTIGIVALIAAFIILNYNQLLGAHKEIQTGIDAAALAAAKDMSRVVVNGPLGRIGLVDDTPAFVVPNGMTGKADPRPIIGVNTLMGTLRLDAIIASKLSSGTSQSGNAAILYLVQHDLQNAKAAALLLRSTLAEAVNGGTAMDKFGNTINIKQDVINAYLGNKKDLALKTNNTPNITIAFGFLDPTQSTTNVPTPKPASEDPLTQGHVTYPPYQDIAASGSGVGAQMKFQFVPLAGASVALVSNEMFRSAPPTTAAAYVAPSVVQVTVDEGVRQGAQIAKAEKKVATLHEVATAECGGTANVAFPTGAFEVSFANAGGLPDKQASAVDFTSVVSLMNAAPADPVSGQAAPSWPGPGNGEPQPWFKAVGGAVPANAGASLQAAPFKGISSQMVTNPSVALSFGVYDWLRTLGLRPNITSVVNALKLANLNRGFYDLQDRIVNQNYQSVYRGFPISFMFGPDKTKGDEWMQPAYAERSSRQQRGMTTAFLDISLGNEDGDRRNLKFWNRDPEQARRQQSNVWGYVPAEPVIAEQARLVQVVNGYVATTDGNPVEVLNSIYAGIRATTASADQTQTNAWKILQERMNKLIKENPSMDMKQVTAKAIELEPRASFAMHNSSMAIWIMYTMGRNFKVLTGLGANEVNRNHYILAGSHFFPANKAASVEDIRSERAIPTGQDKDAPGPKDWCAPTVKQISQLEFYKHADEPVIGSTHSVDTNWYEQPAMAISPPPSSQNVFDKLKFIFTVQGGASGDSPPGTGQIQMVVGQAPFSGQSILPGQQLYQSVHALMTTVTTPPTTSTVPINQWHNITITQPGTTTSTVYQVQARDENANAYPNLSADPTRQQAPAGYFADMNAQGGAKTVGSGQSNWCQQQQSGTPDQTYYPNCPALAFEWQLSCPIAQTTMGDVPVPIQPVTFQPAYSYNYSTFAGSSGTSRSLIYSGCAQWATNNGVEVWSNSRTDWYNLWTVNVASYWSVGGMLFSTGALGDYQAQGNGWNVGTTAATSTSYAGQWGSTYSWTTQNYIFMIHS
jgi:hypothetical protein